MLLKDSAICIKALDYSETSQIVTFFTKANGKISAIAKGSKRPKSTFDGPLEIFSTGQIVFSKPEHSGLATLTEFQQQLLFTKLTANLFVMNCSLFAAELVNEFTHDHDPHPKLFETFLQFLQNTNETQDTLMLLILFQLSLLKEVGLQPILNACGNCKTKYQTRDTKHELYFSSSVNSLICRDCEANFPDRIRLTTVAANALLNLKLLAESNEKTLTEIEKLLIHHLTVLLHKPPKMAKYITQPD